MVWMLGRVSLVFLHGLEASGAWIGAPIRGSVQNHPAEGGHIDGCWGLLGGQRLGSPSLLGDHYCGRPILFPRCAATFLAAQGTVLRWVARELAAQH